MWTRREVGGALFPVGRPHHVLSLAVCLLHWLKFWHVDQGTRPSWTRAGLESVQYCFLLTIFFGLPHVRREMAFLGKPMCICRF